MDFTTSAVYPIFHYPFYLASRMLLTKRI